LEATLKGVTRVEKGVVGKPTIRFSGVNVQIVNGEGKTASVNGEGNLAIGYDETEGGVEPGKSEQSGSHNLILGELQTVTSYGGLVAGIGNTISAPFASVSGGWVNNASGERASVTGGYRNTASAPYASVTGGSENTSSKAGNSVSGGSKNTAAGFFDNSISGGVINRVEGNTAWASITGGGANTITGKAGSATISGGTENLISGSTENIFAQGELAWIGGGRKNHAEGNRSSIFGGFELKTTGELEACGGFPTPSC
jgi:hypothetical protein